MKITFLQSSLWLSGGARVDVEFANLLAARGHTLRFVIPKGAIDPEIAAAVGPDLEIIEASVPLYKPDEKPASLWDKVRLTLAMAAAVPKSDVIVATHTPTTLVNLIAGPILRKGTIVWYYADYPGMFTGRPAEGWLLRNAMRWHRGAFVNSKHSSDELLSFAGGDIRYVGHALNDFDLFREAHTRRAAVKTANQQIMYLGDFRPRKGLADFLTAARIVHAERPDVDFLLVLKEAGEIDTTIPYRLVVRPTTPELVDLYAQSDLFVSASWHEGFGLPPLEAMACGTPVVLTDSGGVRDFARHGENCLMVQPKEPEKLASAMLEVLNSPALAAKFAENAPPTAEEFSWEKSTDRLEACLLDFSGLS